VALPGEFDSLGNNNSDAHSESSKTHARCPRRLAQRQLGVPVSGRNGSGASESGARFGFVALSVGLSSIIELSQAQLNETQAQIEEASARYDYQAEISALNYQIGSLH